MNCLFLFNFVTFLTNVYHFMFKHHTIDMITIGKVYMKLYMDEKSGQCNGKKDSPSAVNNDIKETNGDHTKEPKENGNVKLESLLRPNTSRKSTQTQAQKGDKLTGLEALAAVCRGELHSPPRTESFHVSGNTKQIAIPANKPLLLKPGLPKIPLRFQTSQANQIHDTVTTQSAGASRPSIRPIDIGSSPSKRIFTGNYLLTQPLNKKV